MGARYKVRQIKQKGSGKEGRQKRKLCRGSTWEAREATSPIQEQVLIARYLLPM